MLFAYSSYGPVICLRTCFFFFFNDTATTEIYTLSLHDALPIFVANSRLATVCRRPDPDHRFRVAHTAERARSVLRYVADGHLQRNRVDVQVLGTVDAGVHRRQRQQVQVLEGSQRAEVED